ncbi:hypothetical protein C0991_002934 [Blastosporella zonata]|nr:hypothetical protein C0991_002934 [Blastosporella zonata]
MLGQNKTEQKIQAALAKYSCYVKRADVELVSLQQFDAKYWHMWGDASDIMISLRPTETPTLFNFDIGGLNVSHVQLSSDEDALRKLLLDNIASDTELNLGKLA